MGVTIPPSAATSNVFNPNVGKNLAKWRLAVAKVRDGAANARLLCVGDSTTSGLGSTLGATYPNTGSFPTRLAALLNSGYAPASNSLAVPGSYLNGATDNRWTLGAGWATGGFGAANGACYSGSSPAGSLVFAPGVNADRYYVYWLGNTGLGTLTVTATGGSATPIGENTTLGIYRTSVSAASASASNTVTITGTGAVYVVGVEPYLSTASQILVGNAGVPGATTANWVANPTSFGGAPFIKTVAPDLTLISLGVNDAANSVAPATFAANIQSLITAAQTSGDCILMDWPPSSTAPQTAYEPQYAPQLAALAAANNCTYLSIYNRFNGAYAGGSWMADTLHFNDDGYWDWADFIRSVLTRP